MPPSPAAATATAPPTTARLDLDLAKPEGLGGDGTGSGTNPEQLLAIGWAACFEGAIVAVAGNDHDVSGVSIASSVELGKTSTGLGLRATLDVTLPGLDADVAGQLVGKAHQGCPYSNATRGNVDVTLIANGSTLVG